MVVMTDLMSRPILRVPRVEARPERPVALVAAVGAAAAAAGGLAICVAIAIAGWFAADTGGLSQAMSVGALGWLLGNGSGLSGGGLDVGAVPLGFTILCALALYRFGRWAASTSKADSRLAVGLAALAMSATYAAVGAAVSSVVSVDGVHATLPRAVGACAALGLVFGGAGLLRGSGLGGQLLARLPEEVRAAVLGGLGGALAMVLVASLVLALSLAAHFSTAVTLAEGMHAGLVGGIIFALVGALLVPNAVLCAGSFVAGPGFAVGAGTQVAPSGIHVGLLPDFPILAAIPTRADSWWLPALIVVPVLAGVVCGLLAVRRYPVFGIDRAALRGALAGLVGGLLFGASMVAATGSVGGGRLAHVGPDVLGTLAVSTLALTLGGVVGAVASRLLGGLRLGRRRSAPDDESDESDIPVRSFIKNGAGADDEATQLIALPNDPNRDA